MRRPSEEVVDGQVTGYGSVPAYAPPGGHTTQLGPDPGTAAPPPADPNQYVPQSSFFPVGPSASPPPALNLTADSRGRAIALFVEVPLLAYVALTPGISGLVRLAAAGLGVYRVAQVMGPSYELQFSEPG